MGDHLGNRVLLPLPDLILPISVFESRLFILTFTRLAKIKLFTLFFFFYFNLLWCVNTKLNVIYTYY
jgi:hypothetical protein